MFWTHAPYHCRVVGYSALAYIFSVAPVSSCSGSLQGDSSENTIEHCPAPLAAFTLHSDAAQTELEELWVACLEGTSSIVVRLLERP